MKQMRVVEMVMLHGVLRHPGDVVTVPGDTAWPGKLEDVAPAEGVTAPAPAVVAITEGAAQIPAMAPEAASAVVPVVAPVAVPVAVVAAEVAALPPAEGVTAPAPAVVPAAVVAPEVPPAAVVAAEGIDAVPPVVAAPANKKTGKGGK